MEGFRGGREGQGSRGGGRSFGGNRGGGGGGRGFGGNRGGGGGGYDGPREMHKATCSECGKECEVPFKPTDGKPVYCRDCYRNKKQF